VVRARQQPLFAPEPLADRIEVAPGAVWLPGFLDLETQRAVLETAREWLDGPAGGYVPTVRGGGRMHVTMMCLGRHWNARTYGYEPTRRDFDQAPVPGLPAAWRALAQRAAKAADFQIAPDIGIINWYDEDGRMGLHVDAGEGRASLEAGVPVVSFSIGDTGRFLFGGLTRGERPQVLMLASGDAFVFGGPARLRYHGITRIIPDTAPSALACHGRLNLTFRQY
jgi:alkylated DNA repair protein (DNA oxidative demethylase)